MGYITSKGSGFANVLTVGLDSRSDHTTVQAAVDAAVAAGASISNPWVIKVGPGVDLTHTPVPGVSVIPDSDDISQFYPHVPQSSPPDFWQIPTGDLPMVALQCDDGAGRWFDTDGIWGGGEVTTPAAYCGKEAIPVDHACIADAVVVNSGTHTYGGYMTLNELHQLAAWAGHTMSCHGKTHENPDWDDWSSVYEESVGAADKLRNLEILSPDYVTGAGSADTDWRLVYSKAASISSHPYRRNWFNVDGWVTPGSWRPPPSLGTQWRYEEKRQGHAALLRNKFAWSVIETINHDYGSMPVYSRHFITRKYMVAGGNGTVSHVTPGAGNLLAPNSRTLLWFHAPMSDWSGVKTAWDRLVAARNAGQLILVTPRALVSAIPYSSTTWGGLQCGDFEDMTTLDVSRGAGSYRLWWGDASISSGTGVGGSKSVKINAATTQYVMASCPLIPGATYCLRFAARRTNNSTGVARIYYRNTFLYTSGDYPFSVGCIIPVANYTDYSTFYRTFTVPLWCDYTDIVFQGRAANTEDIHIDNVEMIRIG